MNCIDLVELVTAYVEDALPERERTEYDEHLGGCAGCTTLVSQWRTVVGLTGRLTEDDVNRVDPLTRDQLMAGFRRARRRC